jgi:hypothetical protein
MSLTEEALFELKQGFCRVNDSAKFDEGAFAMANNASDAPGVIYHGVADDEHDAEAIARFSGISPHAFDKFYITGTQHEIDALGQSVDEFFRWFTDKIVNSKLDLEFAKRLSASVKPFRYREYLLWKLEPKNGSSPVTYDGKLHDRIGPSLTEVVDPAAIVELVRRF